MNIRSILKQSWQAYKRNWLEFVKAVFAVFILFFAILFVASIPIANAANELNIGQELFEDVGSMTEEEFSNIISAIVESVYEYNPTIVIISIIILLVGILIASTLDVGLIKVAQDSINGKANWKSMFSTAKQKFMTIIGAQIALMFVIVLSAAIVVGLIGSIVLEMEMLGIILYSIVLLGWILLIAHFSFIGQAIVIDDANVIESLKASWKFVRINFKRFLIIFLGMMIVSGILGSITGIIGSILGLLQSFVISPLFVIIYTLFYLTHRPGMTTRKKRMKRRTVRRKKRRVVRRKKRRVRRKRRR